MSQASGSDRRARLTGLAALALSLALLALATPLTGASSPASRVGWLLAVAAGVEALHALRRATAAARRQATVGALISLAIALFLINAPLVASEALRYVVAAWFAIDAVRDGLGSFRRETRAERWLAAAAALGNAAVALGLVLAHGWMLAWVVAIAGALRICGIAWNIMAAPVYTTAEADETIVSELGLTDQPGAAAIAAEVQASEQARAPIDRGWTVAFIATLFAIHAGRMSIDRTMLGLVSPAVAVLGDMLIAVLFTLLVINPAQLLRARVEEDLRVTSTTDNRIDELIREAGRLRAAYGVPTGFQQGPFFELQTDRFALIAVDTGILRSIDRAQAAWLDAALARASGKATMAILGHPFFAGGHDTTAGDETFARLKDLLRSRGVTVVMAGDTHDLEYYAEPGSATAPAVHYFVNGGGGAYLSFGAALAWPERPPTADWAYYPDGAAVTQKIDAMTPWWKRPAWWWTRQFGAWPFSAEWLSGAFDYNVAPFFQSFVEIRVERSADRVRVIPYGVHGRLTWDAIASSASLKAVGGRDAPFVEWSVPMTPAAAATKTPDPR